MATLNPPVGTAAYTETLLELRNRVLVRLGFAAQIANPPPGMDVLIKDFLTSAQKGLMKQFPALVTERFFSWTMVAGTRFYDTDADDEGATSPDYILDPRRIVWVGIEDLNGSFYPLTEGIDPRVYTQDPNEGLPRWYEIRQSIEVFPAPDQAYTLHIKGRYGPLPFADDADVASIDPELIFLLALGNAKLHYQQGDANTVLGQASTYLGNLTSGAHGTARYVPGTTDLTPITKPVLLPPP